MWDNKHRNFESHEDEEFEEFPKAEARRQNEDNVHQITNLKIMPKLDINKNDTKVVSRKGAAEGETSIAKVKMLNFSEKSKPKKENVKLTKNGVFSQVRVRNRLYYFFMTSIHLRIFDLHLGFQYVENINE